jgi:hypothetical protein
MGGTNHHDWMCCGYKSGNKNGIIGAAAVLYTLILPRSTPEAESFRGNSRISFGKTTLAR